MCWILWGTLYILSHFFNLIIFLKFTCISKIKIYLKRSKIWLHIRHLDKCITNFHGGRKAALEAFWAKYAADLNKVSHLILCSSLYCQSSNEMAIRRLWGLYNDMPNSGDLCIKVVTYFFKIPMYIHMCINMCITHIQTYKHIHTHNTQ